MSDPRYIIEITTSTTDAGVVNVKKVGEMVLTTTDPVEADQFRKTLAGLLRQPGVMDAPVHVALQMETVERRLVLCAMDEDYFRRKRPDRSAGAALAVETPGAEPGFDRAMNEAAAATRALGLVDDHLSHNRAMTADQAADVVLSLAYYDLLDEKRRAILADYAPDHHIALPVLRDAALALSTTVRQFPLAWTEPVDTDRWLAITRQMMHHNNNSTSQPNAKACVVEADLDFKACVGRVVETTFVNGYDLGTNDQNDHVTGAGEPPYRVVVVGCDDMNSQWCDEDLDPKWDVRPAPDETRLDGLRSLWTFGPSYRDATVSQKQA